MSGRGGNTKKVIKCCSMQIWKKRPDSQSGSLRRLPVRAWSGIQFVHIMNEVNNYSKSLTSS